MQDLPIKAVLKCLTAALLAVSTAWPAWSAPLPLAAGRSVGYTNDVEPLFAAHCYSCHGPKKQESNLRLDTKAGAMKGGEDFGNKVIIPGQSADSVLIQAVAQTHPDLKMPKKGDRLTAEQVGVLRAWIDQGAAWPDQVATGGPAKDHWAFKPPVRPVVPRIQNSKLKIQTPIDAFVAAVRPRLQERSLLIRT